MRRTQNSAKVPSEKENQKAGCQRTDKLLISIHGRLISAMKKLMLRRGVPHPRCGRRGVSLSCSNHMAQTEYYSDFNLIFQTVSGKSNHPCKMRSTTPFLKERNKPVPVGNLLGQSPILSNKSTLHRQGGNNGREGRVESACEEPGAGFSRVSPNPFSGGPGNAAWV